MDLVEASAGLNDTDNAMLFERIGEPRTLSVRSEWDCNSTDYTTYFVYTYSSIPGYQKIEAEAAIEQNSGGTFFNYSGVPSLMVASDMQLCDCNDPSGKAKEEFLTASTCTATIEDCMRTYSIPVRDVPEPHWLTINEYLMVDGHYYRPTAETSVKGVAYYDDGTGIEVELFSKCENGTIKYAYREIEAPFRMWEQTDSGLRLIENPVHGTATIYHSALSDYTNIYI